MDWFHALYIICRMQSLFLNLFQVFFLIFRHVESLQCFFSISLSHQTLLFPANFETKAFLTSEEGNKLDKQKFNVIKMLLLFCFFAHVCACVKGKHQIIFCLFYSIFFKWGWQWLHLSI